MRKHWRKFVITAIVAMGLGGGALAAVSHGGGSFGYTCDSMTGQCTCTGVQDCFNMGRGHDCNWTGPKGGPSCNPSGDSCTCTWWTH